MTRLLRLVTKVADRPLCFLDVLEEDIRHLILLRRLHMNSQTIRFLIHVGDQHSNHYLDWATNMPHYLNSVPKLDTTHPIKE